MRRGFFFVRNFNTPQYFSVLNTIVGGAGQNCILPLRMVEKIDIAVANVLRRFRESSGLSQEQLSFKADLHRTYISQLERGLKSATLKTLLKITTAMNVEIVEFIKEIQNELKNLPPDGK